jgi:hypothetical protein
MRFKLGAVGIAILSTISALANPTVATAQGVVIPQPIPARFNFPVPAATINSWISSGDMNAMRNHAWTLWAALTANSGQISGGIDLPIWETWYGSEQVFPSNAAPTNAAALMALVATRPRQLRAFISPEQFHHRKSPAAAAQNIAVQVVSFNKFDPAAATFITSPPTGTERTKLFV